MLVVVLACLLWVEVVCACKFCGDVESSLRCRGTCLRVAVQWCFTWQSQSDVRALCHMPAHVQGNILQAAQSGCTRECLLLVVVCQESSAVAMVCQGREWSQLK